MDKCVICEKEFQSTFLLPPSFLRSNLRWERFPLFESIKIQEPFPMSRYTRMTLGFLLIFLGVKFHMVKSYTLTPRATKFYVSRVQSSLAENSPVTTVNGVQNYNGSGNANTGSPGIYNSQYNNYGQQSGFNSWGSYSNRYTPNNIPNNNSGVFQNAAYQSSLSPNGYNGSYANGIGGANLQQKTITSPAWLGWPVLFLGAVFVIHGAIRRRS